MHLDYSAANAEDGAVLWWRRRIQLWFQQISSLNFRVRNDS